MTDNIERTIAALREKCAGPLKTSDPQRTDVWVGLPLADILALCDAAERGLRCPPREPTKYGCHCDIEAMGPGFVPDACVFDNGDIEDCIYATQLQREGKGKLDCAYWRPINEGGQERSTGDNPERNVPVPPSPASPLPDDRYCWHAWKYGGRRSGCVVNCGKPRATLSPSPHDDTDEGTCAARTVNRSKPSPDAPAPDAFSDLPRLIFELVGAASMCWEPRPSAAVFDSQEATKHAEEAIAAIRAMRDDALERLTAELAEARRERDDHAAYCAGIERELNEARAECERLRADAERYWPFVEMVAKGRSPRSNDVLDAMEMERGRMRAAIGAGRKV